MSFVKLTAIILGHNQDLKILKTFPWTFGHPEKSWNVSTEAGASFTKEAHHRKASGKEVLQYGMCHRDFKGTVVLMSTSMPSIILPVHRTYADYIHQAKKPLSNTMEPNPTFTLSSITCDSDSPLTLRLC